MRIAKKLEFPICMHLTDCNGKDYPNKVLTDNRGAFDAAIRNPSVKFLFSHFAGGEVFAYGIYDWKKEKDCVIMCCI